MIRVILAYQPGHPSREKPAALVSQWLLELGWPVTRPRPLDPAIPFNVGHLKNRGVAATGPGHPHDVLVLCDADCVAPPGVMLNAVWDAYNTPGVVWCGNQIRILTEEAMTKVTRWQDAAYGSVPNETRPTDSTPQLLAIRRDCFDELGGYDEQYVGYGFEDYDFRERAGRWWRSRSVLGTMVHLWHEPDVEKSMEGHLWRANRDRWLASGGRMWSNYEEKPLPAVGP